MKISFKPSFVRDFKKLPKEIKAATKKICLEVFPKISGLSEFQYASTKPIKGFKNYYRIRLDNYRIGFKTEDGEVIFMRVKHRKDIYKFFP